MSTQSYQNHLVLEEIDDHFHNREHWRGPQAGAGKVAGDVLASFQPVSGNNVFGAALQLLDVNDTPILAGFVAFDLRMLFFTAASTATLNKLRIIYGTTTAANAEAANQFTEMVYQEDAGAANRRPVELRIPRLPVGTKVWAKLWNAANLATVSFQFGLHEYPPPAIDLPVLV